MDRYTAYHSQTGAPIGFITFDGDEAFCTTPGGVELERFCSRRGIAHWLEALQDEAEAEHDYTMEVAFYRRGREMASDCPFTHEQGPVDEIAAEYERWAARELLIATD